MKFHKIPSTYNWNNMQTGTTDTQSLIYNIGLATGMNYGPDGSGTTITKATQVFSSWGYNVTKKNHNITDVKSEFSTKRRPVYMQGLRKAVDGTMPGHSWVCEGIRLHSGYSYFVEYYAGGSYNSRGFPSYLSPSYGGSETTYLYLNWGM